MTTYAFRPNGGDWIEVSGEVVLPGFGDDGGDVRVNPAFVESLGQPVRAALGLVAVGEVERPAGVRVLGYHVADDDGLPTQVWDVEPFDEAAIAAQQAACARSIEAEAGRRIDAILPTSRQLWNIAAVLDRIITHGADPAGWPQADQDALPAIQAAWAQIQGVGDAALAIEAAIPGDAAAIADLAAGLADNPAWP